MVLIEATVLGLEEFRKGAQNLRSIEKQVNRRVIRGVTSIPNTKYTELKALYKNSPNKLSNITAEIEASSSTITEEVVVFNEGLSHSRKIGSVRTTGTSLEGVIRKFRKESNTIFLSIPSVSKSKVVAINPTASDLVVTKDNRGTNLYNISLKPSAIRRIANEFNHNVQKLIEKEASVDYISKSRPSGLNFEIAGKIGVSADKIHVVPSLSSVDLTARVRKQVRKNMSPANTTMAYERSIAMKKLVNRTNGFVNNITNVRVKDKTAIGYKTKDKKNDMYEKPVGSVTTIKPTNGKVLVFTNLKTGDKVFTSRARVKSRPVIRKSIRQVAMQLFGRRLNIEKD